MQIKLNLNFSTEDKTLQAFQETVNFFSAGHRVLFSTISETGENLTVKFNNWLNYHRNGISRVDFLQKNQDHIWVQYYAMEMTVSPEEFIAFAISAKGLNQPSVIELRDGKCWIYDRLGKREALGFSISSAPVYGNYFKMSTKFGVVS